MNGKFRNACIREASRAGRRESVKLAEARRASLSNGGRPCLHLYRVSPWLQFPREHGKQT